MKITWVCWIFFTSRTNSMSFRFMIPTIIQKSWIFRYECEILYIIIMHTYTYIHIDIFFSRKLTLTLWFTGFHTLWESFKAYVLFSWKSVRDGYRKMLRVHENVPMRVKKSLIGMIVMDSFPIFDWPSPLYWSQNCIFLDWIYALKSRWVCDGAHVISMLEQNSLRIASAALFKKIITFRRTCEILLYLFC